LGKLESWIAGHRRLVLTVILGANLFLCLALFDPKLNCGGDNAEYIVLAESLVQPGDGRWLSHSPIEPAPQIRLPFGYPMLLAPLYALFGFNLIVFKLLSLCFAVASVALFSLLVRPLFPPLTATALTLALAFNPEIINHSHWTLTETPFLFFSLLSLLLFFKSENKEPEKPARWFWLATACIAFTVHIRTIGLALAGAGLIYYALHRKWKKIALFTLCMAVLLSPLVIHNIMTRQEGSSYIQVILMKEHYDPALGAVNTGEMADRLTANLREFFTRTVSGIILDSETVLNGNAFTVTLISLVSTILILLGFFTNIFKRIGIIKLYTLAYTGILLTLPEKWFDIRYIIPITPFLLIYMADGAVAAARLSKRKLAASLPLSAAAALLVAFIGLGVQLVRIPANLQMIRQYLLGDRYAGYIASWRHFFEAADWAGENTPESSVFTVRKPSLFYLHSGRKSNLYPFNRNVDSVFAEISETDYVVINLLRAEDQLLHIHKTISNYLVPAMEKHPERFKLLFRTSKPSAFVWQVTKTDQYEASDSSAGKEPDSRPDFTSFQQLITNDSTDIKKSIAYYQQILGKKEFNFEALKNLAFLYWQLEKLEESVKYYELAAEARPLDEYMLHYAGKLNQILERYERAEIYYNRLLAKNPRETATLVNMGMIQSKQGRPEKAEEFYLKALAVDSTDSSANFNYANLFFITKRLDLAEKHYKKVLEKEPYDSKTHRFLGRLYLNDPARYEEALHHFRILCRLVPQEADELNEKYIKRLETLLARSERTP